MLVTTLPAFATCCALLLYLALSLNVSRARGRYGIAAPATTGHPEFERRFRVQQNTAEQLILFLPSLWLFAFLVSAAGAAALGLLWVAARALYALGYYRRAERRGIGYAVALFCSAVLLLGSFTAVLRALALGLW